MAYTFNPTPAEASLLAQIAQRESAGNYASAGPWTSTGMPSGAYQFKPGTWQMAAAATGEGTQYASAADAPASVQDVNALYMLRRYGANATITWAASAPPGGYTATASGDSLVDITGTDASVSTSDILDQLSTSASDAFSQLDPTTGVAIALGIGLLAFVAMGN